MIWLHIQPEIASRLDAAPTSPAATGYLWLDVTDDEFAADPGALRETVRGLTGVRIDELHLKDAGNLQHPSYFGSIAGYDMLIFRKLTPGEDRSLTPLAELDELAESRARGRRLQPIVTRPVTFFIFERLLVTVRNEGSRTIEQVRQRLLEPKARGTGKGAVTGSADAPAPRLP